MDGMSNFNPYQQMHYEALYGKSDAITSVIVPLHKAKRYSLYYGNQVILRDQPYPMCKAKQKELKQTGNYNLQTFKISR